MGHFGGHLGSPICAPVHAGACLVKIHVFDVDKLPRRVLDATWPNLGAKSAENDPNLAPQDDPKSIKNRVQKMIKILIDFKTAGMRFLVSTGGMRNPPGGTLGRSKNSAKEYLQYIAKNFEILNRCLTRPCSAPEGRAADLIASRIPPGRVMTKMRPGGEAKEGNRIQDQK